MILPIAAKPDRQCGTCTYCCRLPDIEALEKPANAWCRHCVAGAGCSIYATRPTLCRDFHCLWITDGLAEDYWQPERAKMMLYRQGPQWTVLVDPDHPDQWRKPPYHAALSRLAEDISEAGGYVIVFVGDDVFKVEAEAGSANRGEPC